MSCFSIRRSGISTPTSDEERDRFVRNKVELAKSHAWSHETFQFFKQFFHSNRTAEQARYDVTSGDVVTLDNDERELNQFKMQLYMGSVFGPASLLNSNVGHASAMRN